MFSGIIAGSATVASLRRRGAGAVLQLAAEGWRVEAGESIAVDGACLTAVDDAEGGFQAELSAETLLRTSLGDRKRGDTVNLERSLRLGDRMGGHFVLGHVDATGETDSLAGGRGAARLVVRFPLRYDPLVVEKGSIAVNGVSLTVAACRRGTLEAALVPYTLTATNLGRLRQGSRVNLEFDYLAKLVQGQMQRRQR